MEEFVPELVVRDMLATVLLASAMLALVGFAVDTVAEAARGTMDWRRWPWRAVALLAFTVPVALAAYVSGYLATMSRTTAVGNVLPAVLALLGGLNVYVFGTDTRHRVLVGYCSASFVIMLFYGAQVGGHLREATREDRLQAVAQQEFRLRAYRRDLGLPEEFPGWAVGSEPK